ncbi:MAG: TonB-dependent receptor [Planctomycetota bacterium]
MRRHRLTMMLATTGMALLLATPAHAQTGGDPADPAAAPSTDDAGQAAPTEAGPEQEPLRLPAVRVTARKWAELAQDIPLSVTVVPEQTLADGGYDTINEAAILVPNFNMVEFTSRRLSFPFIRGIGSGQGDPAVTTYVDGVPQLSVSSTNLRLLDLERVEFLRGPQGTLYGRNAIGGLMHLISKRPTNTPSFRAGATFGNYDLQEYELSYSGPLVDDRLFIGLSGLYSKRDGYTINSFTGNDVDDRESFFGRGQLLWTPDDQNEFRFVLYGEESRDGGFVLSDLDGLHDRPHRIFQDFEGVSERDILSTSLTWNHYGEAVDFTSITAYVDWDILETSDFDFSAADAVRRRTEEDQDSISQEFRLASSEDAPLELNESAALKWQAGVLLFDADSNRSAANNFRADAPMPAIPGSTDRSVGDFDDTAVGVFGQVTLTLADRLDLTAGLRYDYETKDADIRRTFDIGGFVASTDFRDEDESYDEFVPRFSAAYRWQERLMTYVSAARGWKAGGFNLTSPAGQTSFDPETSWTYEAGVKSSWLDDRLVVNAAVFYIDWDDMQLSQFDFMAGGYVTNAGESTSKGFEIELLARPLKGLEIFGGFGFTDTEFDEFVDSFGADVRGNDLPFAPETTFSAGAQVTAPLGGNTRLFARGEYQNIGTFYYDAGNPESEVDPQRLRRRVRARRAAAEPRKPGDLRRRERGAADGRHHLHAEILSRRGPERAAETR